MVVAKQASRNTGTDIGTGELHGSSAASHTAAGGRRRAYR